MNILQVKRATEFSLCLAIKFTYGFLFGSFVYWSMFKSYAKYVDFEFGSYLPEFVFSLATALIYLSFLSFRAIATLFLPSMIGSVSQNYVLTMLFVLIATNPLSNLASNIVEATRVVGCSLSMTFENLKERAKLILNPIIELLEESGEDTFMPLKSEFDNIKQVLDTAKNCTAIFEGAKESCDDAVNDINSMCIDEIGSFLGTIFCSPIKLSNNLCSFAINKQNMCESLLTDKYVTRLYDNLTQQLNFNLNQNIKQSPKQTTINFSLSKETKKLFSDTKSLVDHIKQRYKLRRSFFNIFLFVYDFITSVTFVLIINKAYLYHKSYTTANNLKFDNCYITGQFILIDEQKKKLGKASVLPLQEEEKRRYIPTLTCAMRTRQEKQVQRSNCAFLCLAIALSVSLLYLDDILSSILASINEHALIEFKQSGKHNLNFKIAGNGSLARLVRQITTKLNSQLDLNRLTTSQSCLPKRNSTECKFYLSFISLFVLYLLIDQVNIYAMRFRRLTCAFFYPEIERTRIFYLHSTIIKRRSYQLELSKN